MTYWKAVIRYGHVGRRNEISVARHMEFPKDTMVYDVIREIHSMPGTKNNCIASVHTITRQEYETGKKEEQHNFYLQNLFPEGA